MAVVYIAEYAGKARDEQGYEVEAGQEPALAEQTVSITGSSVQSAAFDSRTRFVRVHCDAVCHVAFGADPAASGATKRMAGDQTEFFGVAGGHKLAVIAGA